MRRKEIIKVTQYFFINKLYVTIVFIGSHLEYSIEKYNKMRLTFIKQSKKKIEAFDSNHMLFLQKEFNDKFFCS